MANVIYNQATIYLEMNVAMDKEWSIDIFTKNLKMYMEPFGKNQKKMAAIVGVSLPTFHDWLKGKKMPRMNNVQTKNQVQKTEKDSRLSAGALAVVV